MIRKKSLLDEARAYKQRHGYDPRGLSLDDVGGVEKNNLLQFLPSKNQRLQTEGFKSPLKIGSLSDKAELIAPEWTRMARSARRLRKKGYKHASEKMALDAEGERLNTPSIRSQGFRGEDKKRREGIAAQRAQEKELTMKLMQELLRGSRSPTEDAVYRGHDRDPYYGQYVRM